MEPRDYTVIKIEGEYATLRDDLSGEDILVALFLLPQNVDVGKHLHFDMFEYSLMN